MIGPSAGEITVEWGHAEKIRHGSNQGNTLRRSGRSVAGGKVFWDINLRRQSARAYTDESVTLTPRNLNHARYLDFDDYYNHPSYQDNSTVRHR